MIGTTTIELSEDVRGVVVGQLITIGPKAPTLRRYAWLWALYLLGIIWWALAWDVEEPRPPKDGVYRITAINGRTLTVDRAANPRAGWKVWYWELRFELQRRREWTRASTLRRR